MKPYAALRDTYLRGRDVMINVYLTLNDTYVSYRFGTSYGSEPCDTSNLTAALARAFKNCIEAMTEPYETITVHHFDLRGDDA
jgi:hypothetical protein